MKRHVLILCLVAVASALVGCSSGPKKYNLVVHVDPQLLQTSSVNVDLIGANDSVTKQIDNQELSEYWDLTVEARRARYTGLRELHFPRGSTDDLEIRRGDASWKTWRKQKASNVMVLTEGTPTYLKESIDLNEKWGSRTLIINIDSSGIFVNADVGQ
jgi:hypothetical protein